MKSRSAHVLPPVDATEVEIYEWFTRLSCLRHTPAEMWVQVVAEAARRGETAAGAQKWARAKIDGWLNWLDVHSEPIYSTHAAGHKARWLAYFAAKP